MLKNQSILKFIFITNFLILIFVYYVEYGMNIYACKLCKYQRIPFFINLIILSIYFLNQHRFSKLLYALLVSIFMNISISFYHIGVENKIFAETKACNVDRTIGSKDDLLNQLKKQGISGCSEVTFRIFGLSLSTLNFLSNIVFFIICVHILRNEKK